MVECGDEIDEIGEIGKVEGSKLGTVSVRDSMPAVSSTILGL